MESFGSSPNPLRRGERSPVPIYLLVANEDHPRACTGRKLLARRLAVRAHGRRPGGALPVLLDPYAQTPLSRGDRGRAESGGLLAIDCSWNRLSLRGEFLPGLSGAGHQPHRRRLPILLATNPQHFGRVGELNTAEAVAAALYLLGENERAESLLDGFAGGPEFFRLNRSALDRYAGCPTPEAVQKVERASSVGA